MKNLSNIYLRRLVTVLSWILLLACSLFPFGIGSSTTTTETATDQPSVAATLSRGRVLGTATLTGTPVDQLGVATTLLADSSSTGPFSFEISDSYQLLATKLIIGSSLAASPGKVWIGTLNGTIQEVDSRSGAFGQTIMLLGGGSMTNIYPIMKMGFEGQYLWVWGNLDENHKSHPYLSAINTASRTVVHQLDLDSTDWLGNEERIFAPEDFGISPGKIWIDNHIVNTLTIEVTPHIYMPAMTLFAYDEKDWMWMTGDTGAGDGLVFVNTDDPSDGRYQTRWPFLDPTKDGQSRVGPSTPMTLAGDRMWMAKSISGATPIYTLEAYWADMDQLMEEMGPLASVPLLDNPQKIKLLFAGNFLWLLWLRGEQAGFLYQLDPQTGATINSLDLVGDQGRSISDVPMDIASEGDNLWILTSRQLLRIKLP